jgi:NAD(P)-dependent dehydrogenase (short-subunit alcohol dehydrogenase family)
MSGDLAGKVAIVTGAAQGIGAGIVTTLAEAGAVVIGADLDEEKLQQSLASLALDGLEVHARRCDVSDKESAESLVSSTIESFGQVDILVNNAGINRDVTLHKMTDEQWNTVLAVDLNAVFFTTRRAMLAMRERGYGRIVNISSASWLGSFGQANYAAAKAGVVGLTLTASREGALRDITANVVCPGFIDTAMTRGLASERWNAVVERIPMQRAGDPRDVGNLVTFLASDKASYITGQVVYVSGGLVW